jgi:hypothetical protein
MENLHDLVEELFRGQDRDLSEFLSTTKEEITDKTNTLNKLVSEKYLSIVKSIQVLG